MNKTAELKSTKISEKLVMDMMKTIHEAHLLKIGQDNVAGLPYIPKQAVKDDEKLSQDYVKVESLNTKFSKYEPHVATDIKNILENQINTEDSIDDYDGKGNALYNVLWILDDYMQSIDESYCNTPQYKFFAGSVHNDKIMQESVYKVISDQMFMQEHEINCTPIA